MKSVNLIDKCNTPDFVNRKDIKRNVSTFLLQKQPSFKTVMDANSPLRRRETLKTVSKNI